jgi:hypothetical protein
MPIKYIDERTERINGQVSFLFLMLTQIALVGVIFYKRYVLGLPASEYDELNWVVGLSMGGYWAIRLYLNGILPLISVKQMVVIYIAAVSIISIPTYFVHGLPAPDRLYEVLYPFIGVAIILVLYTLVAYFGKQRLEREILE